MRKVQGVIVLSLVVALIVAACAPAAGRQAIRYVGTAEEVISTIAEIGPQLQPGGAYNFFSITGVSDRFITLEADTTGGATLLFGRATVRLMFTASQSGDIVTLAVDQQGGGEEALNNIIRELDARFERAPAL